MPFLPLGKTPGDALVDSSVVDSLLGLSMFCSVSLMGGGGVLAAVSLERVNQLLAGAIANT